MGQTERKQERRYCSRLGLALVTVLVWTLVWQFGLALADQVLLGGALPDTAYYLLSLIGHYAVSLPLAFLLTRRVPFSPPSRSAVSPGRFFRWFAVGAAMLWGGSVIGMWANDLAYSFAGREPVDLLTETFNLFPMAVILLGACLLGPVCEEVLFRYLLAGRLRRYGEGTAAFVSGLLFGLFHANLSQFFYAFGLGVLLAYAYFRSGRLLIPILLHISFNLLGSGLPMLLPQTTGVLLLYGLALLALTITGTALFFRGRRRIVWYAGSCPRDAGVLFGNVGMTLAIAACIAELAVNFVFA